MPLVDLRFDFDALLAAHAPNPESGQSSIRAAIATTSRRLVARRALRRSAELAQICAGVSVPAHEQQSVLPLAGGAHTNCLKPPATAPGTPPSVPRTPPQPPKSGGSVGSSGARIGDSTPAAPAARNAAAAALSFDLDRSSSNGGTSAAATRLQAAVRALHARCVLRSRAGGSLRTQLRDVSAMLRDAAAPDAGAFEKQMIPGLRAQLRKQSADLIEMMARPAPRDPSGAKFAPPPKLRRAIQAAGGGAVSAPAVTTDADASASGPSGSAPPAGPAASSRKGFNKGAPLLTRPRTAPARPLATSAAGEQAPCAAAGPVAGGARGYVKGCHDSLAAPESARPSPSPAGGASSSCSSSTAAPRGGGSALRPFLKRRSVTQAAQPVDWSGVGSRVLSNSMDYSRARAARAHAHAAGVPPGSPPTSRGSAGERPSTHAQVLAAQAAGRVRAGGGGGGGVGEAGVAAPVTALRGTCGLLEDSADPYYLRNALAALIADEDATGGSVASHGLGAAAGGPGAPGLLHGESTQARPVY